MTHELQDNVLKVFFGLQDYFLTKLEKVEDKIYLHIHKIKNIKCGTCVTHNQLWEIDKNKRKELEPNHIKNIPTLSVIGIDEVAHTRPTS